MAVLYTQHYVQFFDDNGNPLSGGKLYTYDAGTTTPKTTWTTAAETTPNANPVVLNSAGRATVFLNGSYRFDLKTSADVLISSTDNVTSFAALTSNIPNSQLATMNANTIKANATNGTSVPQDLAINTNSIIGRISAGNLSSVGLPSDLSSFSTSSLTLGGADKKRQIILNAPVDSSGYNSSLPATSGSLSITTQNITSSAPLWVTSGAGYDATGQVNRRGVSTANLTFSGNTGSASISSITRVGTTATLTTSAAHNLVTGSEVTVSGATPSGYNGTYIITVTSSTTFTYVMAADPGASASPVGSYTVTNFLWVDVGTDGVLTPGRTLLPPIYVQGSTPSTTANQFTYNIAEAKGYYGNGSTAPQTYKVFIGEVQASASTITSTVAYSILGYFDSGDISASVNTTYSRNHNIGSLVWTYVLIRPVVIGNVNQAYAIAAWNPDSDGARANGVITELYSRNIVRARTENVIGTPANSFYLSEYGVSLATIRIIAERIW